MDAAARQRLLEALRRDFSKKQLSELAPMSRYTTLRLGGPADVLAEPATVDQLRAALLAAKEQQAPVTLIGNGSNLLVRDGGIRGLVIRLAENFSEVSDPVPLPDGRFALTAQSGATLQKFSNAAADHALCGLEFANGIPGAVGGAAYMNAGAYGGEICQICESVEVMDLDGNLSRLSNAEMAFSYRHSALENHPGIVVSADFALKKGNSEEIWTKMKDLIARRTASQPLDVPSAGSAFKRPTGGYAAALIEEAGLKGYQVGGAAISAKHAGFAVNLGGATAADVKALLSQVSEQVYQKSGIRLEPEVRIW